MLNTGDVVNMSAMFSQAKNTDPDVLLWDTSKVVNMGHMFDGAKQAIPTVDEWDVSKVTDMQYMFRDTSNSRINISKKSTERSG